MASSSRTIPPLLEPYLLLLRTEPAGADSRDNLREPEPEPEPELVIATSVLGASTNWLVLRYLYSFLKQQHRTSSSSPQPRKIHDHQDDQHQSATESTCISTSVVLVSFLRDFAFWRESAGRIGLDLEALTRAGRFGYVDGLGVGLFHSEEKKSAGGGNNPNPPPPRQGLSSPPAARPNPIVPAPGRQPPGTGTGTVPPRGGPASLQLQGPAAVLGAAGGGRIPTATSTSTFTSPALAPGTSAGIDIGGISPLSSPTISHLRSVISSAIEQVRSPGTRKTSEGTKPNNNKVVLIIDQLDFLLAASGGGSANDNNKDEVSAQQLRELLLDLRETTSATILTLSADQPLIDTITTAPQHPTTTPLEKNHAHFVLSLLHEATLVLSLRLLDTGVAKDVSGVLRITPGGGGGGGGGRTVAVEENEYLYHVRGDGSVRVFERGQ